MAAKVRVYCGLSWAQKVAESQHSSLELNQPVTLVLDQPIGFADKILSLLDSPVVVLTEAVSEFYLQSLIRHKPAALLQEPVSPERIKQVLMLVAQGERLAYPELDPLKRLTAREHQVMGLLLHGLEDKEIATELEVEPRTVSHWVASIRQKMGVTNRTQVVLEYLGFDTRHSN